VAAGEQLRVGVDSHSDRVVVRLDGELDLASAPLLESKLDGDLVRDAATVVIDLRGLEFIDSTGLRVIFSAHEEARERGQELAVTRGPEQVERLLSITRVGEHLPVIDSPEELLGQPPRRPR
jgi:anti-sigma B factor antagonist